MDGRSLNRMLESRVKDASSRPTVGSHEERRHTLIRCLGLDPAPERKELNAFVTGTVDRDGYRIEKIVYHSLPGVPVSAHLYLPDGDEMLPVVLRAHGHWEHKKSSAIVQASAIGLALGGFACMVIESPGVSWDDNAANERREMGSHDDWYLSMGWPVTGQYVWDLVRAIDYLETRHNIDATKIGITGESGGGTAAMYAFAADPRIAVAVPVVSTASFEVNCHLGCLCNHLPGITAVGDRAEIMGLRSRDGALFVIAAEKDPEFPIEGHRKTDEKLRKLFWANKNEGRYRFEAFAGGHDYNRRMREAALAFFSEHLLGMPAAPYRPEVRPLTDGALNPYPSGTVSPLAAEFTVFDDPRTMRSMRDILSSTVDADSTEPYRIEERLVSWRKYGSPETMRPGAIIAFHDAGISTPREPGSIALPVDEVDQRLCILLGLSVSEFLAQVIHISVPGGPDAWESMGTGFSGDAITSMIASVKTLVSPPEAPPKMIVAEGPVSSMVARFLSRMRPTLEVQTSHHWSAWSEAISANVRQNAQPNARYLEWI